jgi:hypothetical protein
VLFSSCEGAIVDAKIVRMPTSVHCGACCFLDGKGGVVKCKFWFGYHVYGCISVRYQILSFSTIMELLKDMTGMSMIEEEMCKIVGYMLVSDEGGGVHGRPCRAC